MQRHSVAALDYIIGPKPRAAVSPTLLCLIVSGILAGCGNSRPIATSPASTASDVPWASTQSYVSGTILAGGDRFWSDEHHVYRLGPDGRSKWAAKLEGKLYAADDNVLVADANRVYVWQGDGITALNSTTGAIEWNLPDVSGEVVPDGDVILVHCRPYEKPHWISIRAADTGKETARIDLPIDAFNERPIHRCAGLFLLRDFFTERSLLFDRTGKIRIRLDSRVIGGINQGSGRIFLTGHGIFHASATDDITWQLPFKHDIWDDSGAMLSLPNGDRLAFIYCQIADSGVQVMRFNPDDGHKIWETACNPLGVGHSKYFHRAKVEMAGNQLTVTSRASFGTFVEVLDASTGYQISRVVRNGDADCLRPDE